MNAPPRSDARPAAATPMDLAAAEEHLLNADLRAKRRLRAGELTRAEYAGLRAHLDAALRAVRLLAVATAPPSLRVLAAWGPRR